MNKINRLDNRSIITISSTDRKKMLQNLITANLDSLPKNPVYGALLTPQGKFLHDFFISEWEDILYIECERIRKDDLLKRLMMYRLRADVTITDKAEDFIILASQDKILGENFNYKDPRHDEMGYRAISSKIAASYSKSDDYNERRIILGIGEGSSDFIINKSPILEGNFEEINGVDFKKGCYVGQEVTARMKYRRKIKKRLLPLTLLKGKLEPSAPIFNHQGQKTGEIRSISKSHALALIKLDKIKESKIIHNEQGEFEIKIPKWLKLEEE